MSATAFDVKSTDPLVHWSGLAAMLGGVMWLVKGSAILVTGAQPPVVYEIASVFFALGFNWPLCPAKGAV